MKRTYTLCIITSLIMCILAVGVHRVTRTEEKHLKVGFIFVGDEITPYTENLSKPETMSWKYTGIRSNV